MWACKSGRARAVSLLLDEAQADASLRMKDDSTAFDWAAPRPVEKAVGGAARAPVRLGAPQLCTRAFVHSCNRALIQTPRDSCIIRALVHTPLCYTALPPGAALGAPKPQPQQQPGLQQ